MDNTEPLRRQLSEAIEQASISPAVRKRKLMFWVFRQALLGVLAWYFWDLAWMRWVFWIGMALGVVNLVMLLMMPRFLAGKQRRGNAALDRLAAFEQESKAEGDSEDRH